MGKILLTLFTLFTLFCFTACTTMLPNAQSDTIVQSVEPGDTVVVQLADGTEHTMEVEVVYADRLTGRADGSHREILLADVRTIGMRRAPPAGAWIVIGAAAFIRAIMLTTDSEGKY